MAGPRIIIKDGYIRTLEGKVITDAAGVDCCCEGCDCRCDRAGAPPCCYHRDDVLTLTVDVAWSPTGRYCDERCDTTTALTCFDCITYNDSETYSLIACSIGILFQIDTPNAAFPYYIFRECNTSAWIFYDSALNVIDVEDLPLTALCTLDCEFDPMLCAAIDTCDETLICSSGGVASVGTPPAPYDSCTHNDGDAVGGTAYCFCVGSTCYSYDYKAWVPICTFDETTPGSCVGLGTDSLVIKTLTVTFDITNHCEWSSSTNSCETI